MFCLNCPNELQSFTINDEEDRQIFIEPDAPVGTYTMEITLADDNVDPREKKYSFSIKMKVKTPAIVIEP